MWKVVDANYLQDPELEDFLCASRSNRVVFCEYLLVEAFRGDAQKAFSGVSRFHNQVIVLKSTHELLLVCGRDQTVAKKLIDKGLTRYIRVLLKAGDTDKARRVLAKNRKVATDRIDELDPKFLRKVVAWLREIYTSDALTEYRSTGKLSPASLKDLLDLTIDLMEVHYNNQPLSVSPTPLKQVHNSFRFRMSLSWHLLILDWISKGGVENASIKTLRNDLIDNQYAICASYFDGMLTNDEKAIRQFELLVDGLDWTRKIIDDNLSQR